MTALHMTRVAFGCTDYPTLVERIAARSVAGEVRFTTAMRPKRTDELVGGRLHFIIRHMIVGCVEILRFEDTADGRVDIVCSDALVPVAPTPKRAHQGWRYLKDSDAPARLDAGSSVAALPPKLARALGELALL